MLVFYLRWILQDSVYIRPLIKFYDMFINRVFVVQYFVAIWNSFSFIFDSCYGTKDIVLRQKVR